MDPLRLDSKDRLAPAWAGLGEVGHLPVRVVTTGRAEATAAFDVLNHGASSSRTVDGSRAHDAPVSHRPWWRTLLRVARDAAIGLALITAVPVAIIAVRGVPVQEGEQSIVDRRAQVEPTRVLGTAVDPTVTPMQAGIALHALNRRPANPMFPTRAIGERPPRVWESRTLAPGMLAAPTDAARWRSPYASELLSAATRGFTTEEMDYLRAIAESPVWRDVDLVASAAQVDLIGGAYLLPFQANASVFAMPTPAFADTKALANAAVARAAYYVAVGEPDRAESALRSVVALGFAYIDNGENVLHALVGRVIVGMGRDGLHALYAATNNAPGLALTAPFDAISDARTVPRTRAEVAVDQARVLANAGDPALPRSIRLEQVMLQSLTSCQSVATLLVGTSAQHSAMYDKARAELARFPSERTYLDLLESSSSSLPPEYAAPSSLGDKLVMGAAAVAGTVLRNPRIATCTRLALDNQS